MTDELYERKLGDMQKYVPFLENLIQSLKRSNDEKRGAQLSKMQMFHDLLTNKNKKLKLDTLEKCEQVLVRLQHRAEMLKVDTPASSKQAVSEEKPQNSTVKPAATVSSASRVDVVKSQTSKPVTTNASSAPRVDVVKSQTSKPVATNASSAPRVDVAKSQTSKPVATNASSAPRVDVVKSQTSKPVATNVSSASRVDVVKSQTPKSVATNASSAPRIDLGKSLSSKPAATKVSNAPSDVAPAKDPKLNHMASSGVPKIEPRNDIGKSQNSKPVATKVSNAPSDVPPGRDPKRNDFVSSDVPKIEPRNDTRKEIEPPARNPERIIPDCDTVFQDHQYSCLQRMGGSFVEVAKSKPCPAEIDDNQTSEGEDEESQDRSIASPDPSVTTYQGDDGRSSAVSEDIDEEVESSTNESTNPPVPEQAIDENKPISVKRKLEVAESQPAPKKIANDLKLPVGSQQTITSSGSPVSTEEPEPTCSSAPPKPAIPSTSKATPIDSCKQPTSASEPKAITSSSDNKADSEECSVTSTTAIESAKRDKPPVDDDSSLQGASTEDSNKSESVDKGWIQGALMNLLNPNTLDKTAVLGMLEKVVGGSKFEQIKAILQSEEQQPEEKKPETVRESIMVEKSEEKDEEMLAAAKPEVDKSLEESTTELRGHRIQTRYRKSELERLNEDTRYILAAENDLDVNQGRRACAENKTASYCETPPITEQRKGAKSAADAKPKKKKKKEVFTYRTRRRRRRRKKAPLSAEEVASSAGTESSRGGERPDESVISEDLAADDDEDDEEEVEKKDKERAEKEPAAAEDDEPVFNQTISTIPSQMSAEEIAEREKNFRNIHHEMHSQSKYVAECAICLYSGRYMSSHYMNTHHMTEMVTSRLSPKSYERLRRGDGVMSVFTGKDKYHNRTYNYQCPFCNVRKAFSRKVWSQHFGAHTGEYKYKCSGCGYMSVNVRSHVMKYCPTARPIMMEYLPRGKTIVGFICKLCNYIQTGRERIVEHLRTQHETDEEDIEELTLFRIDSKHWHAGGRPPGRRPGQAAVTAAKKKEPITIPIKDIRTTVRTVNPPPVVTPAVVPPLKITKQHDSPVPPFRISNNEIITCRPSTSKSPAVDSGAKSEEENAPAGSIGKFITQKPGAPSLKNIYPEMHAQSIYASKCVVCQFTGKALSKHYKRKHPEVEVYISRAPPDRLAKLVANESVAKLGAMTVVKYKSYYIHAGCPFCPIEKASQRFDWVMHFAIHTGEYKFKCSQCTHHANARNEFTRHFQNDCPGGKIVRLWSLCKYNEEDPVMGYFCKICKYLQMSRNNIVKHLKTQHNSPPDKIQEVILFPGNPRHKGRRSVGEKHRKRPKGRIRHTVDSETGAVMPEFLCDGEIEASGDELDARRIKWNRDGIGQLVDVTPVAISAAQPDDYDEFDEDDVEDDNGGMENLFQMEMNETPTGDNDSTLLEDKSAVQNIHPEMHVMSEKAAQCVFCNFNGKYISRHYLEDHQKPEVYTSRLPPENQRKLLASETNLPSRCAIRSRKMNFRAVCPFCNLERDCTRHNWIGHFAIHTGEYKYKCSDCPHRGNTLRDFKRHFKVNCRKGRNVRTWPDLVSKEEPIIGYFCDLCNYLQLDRERVVQHLNAQHGCYEQLISKVTLLYIDPKMPREEVQALEPPKPKLLPIRRMGRRGKRRRPISSLWSHASQKRATMQRRAEANKIRLREELGEEGEGEGEEGEEDGTVSEEQQQAQDEAEGSIQVTDSSEDDVPLKQSIIKIESQKKPIPPKIEPSPAASKPQSDQSFLNINPAMHSRSDYATRCVICPYVGRHMTNHYVNFHPRFEVPISRLPPSAQCSIVINQDNVAMEADSNPFSSKIFTYTCMFCDTKFTFTIKSWVDHFGTHTGEYNFKCSDCSRMINSKKDIMEHIRQFCGNGRILARQYPVTNSMRLIAYVCKLCNFIQMNRGNIIQHLRTQHKSLNNDQIMRVILLKFSQTGDDDNSQPQQMLVPKKEEAVKSEFDVKQEQKFATKPMVKVEKKPNIGMKIKQEPDNDYIMSDSSQSNQSAAKQPFRPRIKIASSRPATAAKGPGPSTGQQPSNTQSTAKEVIHRVSQLGYSKDDTGAIKYHCCVRDCNFFGTGLSLGLEYHIMNDHSKLLWEGYCRECQGHVAADHNMTLARELKHLMEHTKKRGAEKDEKPIPAKIPRISPAASSDPKQLLANRPVEAKPLLGDMDESASSIIARFAKNKSITITRETKPIEPAAATTATIERQPKNIVVQQQVLKEVKRTPLKPWTVSKSIKSEIVVRELLRDVSLFAFFKCMGSNCPFTTNDSNQMAGHLNVHADGEQQTTTVVTSANVFSWLECCYCSTWAGTAMQLIAHITAKHSRDIYQCPYCFYRSCEEYNVIIHLVHYHPEKRQSILYCFGRKLLKAGGDIAFQSLKQSRCSDCSLVFMNPLIFATHIAEYTDMDLGGDIYKCYYCSKKHTKSVIEFARHIVEHRNTIRKADSYKCFRCFKQQTSIGQLSNKHNIKCYQCVHCAYSTDEEMQMNLHMAQVHASNLLFCGLRIRVIANGIGDDVSNRMDNGAAFLFLKKPVDERILFRCPYTPSELNGINESSVEAFQAPSQPMEEEQPLLPPGPAITDFACPIINQNPGFLQIAAVTSITNSAFASLTDND